MAITARTIVTNSMRELGILASAEVPSSNDAAWILEKLNDLLNNWNAVRDKVFVEEFLEFVIIPNTAPLTIGIAANAPDYVVSVNRPVAIDMANVILNNVSPSVRNPIQIRTYQWWALNSVRRVTSQYPTDLYYEPAWPNGKIYLWPLPTQAYGLELVVRGVLNDAMTMDTAFSMPPGYKSAIQLTLAEDIAPSFGVSASQKTMQRAGEARAQISANNRVRPTLQTRDAGMPKGTSNRSSFNYRTGVNMPEGR
jgi:hypothetical protein